MNRRILSDTDVYESQLWTLVTRLWVTFEGSALEISKKTIYLFVIIFVFQFVTITINSIGNYSIVYVDGNIGWFLVLFALFLGLPLYIIGCVLAVRLFVKRLSETARMQANSQHDLSLEAEDLSLNSRQQKLLFLSAKYMLLFLVAILSTGLTFCFSYIVSLKLSIVFASFDVCVNLFCLCLQFKFAGKYYRKYCGYLDSRCSALVVKRAKKDMSGATEK